ncbi:MAG: type II toxin-antitoxin system RelE/ParE family toxin [Proteobacteria bacterium]|nr:type II toxin-antitoxin system RelE/ParE family toxin [Pseudomonadota bacterium]MBU1687731.1 type II toxin-antitoxin system RelE/ParE family toxin [Pseudomonadota bacterium]
MKIIWSPLSLERAGEIADYIALDKTTAAIEWIETLFDKVEILKSSPKIGRIVPESCREDIRELLFGNYRIIYLADEKKISILTIRHGKQIMPIDELQA